MTINHERLSAQLEGEALTPEETLRFVKLLFQMCPERRHQAYRSNYGSAISRTDKEPVR